MIKAEARQRLFKLKNLLDQYRYSRHVLDRELVPIEIEDSLKKELFELEQKFPDLATPDSPTQRVAGRPLEKFEKVRHPKPMLSLNDAFSRKDMQDWLDRMARFLGINLTKDNLARQSFAEQKLGGFFCEPKLDGLAVELIYERGTLKTGSTRGDGLVGENVTQNLKTIESIPLKLKIKNLKLKIPPQAVVRAEVIITKKDFEKVNKEQKKTGLPVFANPRNLAAGSIRQLDPKITRKRRLSSTAYSLITNLGQKTHEEEHKILDSLGFKTSNRHSKHCEKLKQVFEFHSFWQKNRDKLPYEIDGLVVTVNNNEIFEKLGVVGKAPRGSIALKFQLKQAATIIEDIKVQVGRTGAVTPIAVLRPVQIGGATVTRATLHNEEEIKRLGLKIGDTVVVGRAGDVIPDIIRVLPELRTGKEKKFEFPKKCPHCQSELKKSPAEAIWRCPSRACFAKLRKYFYHFVSRQAFDIVGLGPKIIDRFIEQGLVLDPADLFKLEQGDLLSLERFAEKSAQNLIKAIQSKKKITLPRFIYALGIRGVGEQTALDLAEHFSSLENLQKAEKQDLESIPDIGPQISGSIYQWFREKRNIEFLEKLKKSNLQIRAWARLSLSQRPQRLKGRVFVLTGALEKMTRQEARQKIRDLGGQVSDTVSQKTNYLIAGKEPGLKLDKAKKLGVKIIDEKEFISILQ